MIKRIALVAVALEALKFLFLFLVLDHIPERFFNAFTTIMLWVLILPEMVVSYEHGPHGLLARVVMFCAGTLVNLALVGLVVAILATRKTKRGTKSVPQA